MNTTSFGSVQVERSGHVATVSWNRPPVNVFDSTTLMQLTATLRSPEVTEARAVVLRGRGRCWSAGNSVEEHLHHRIEDMLKAFRETLRALWNVPVPTIGQVHGACLGGGLELLSMCDLAYAGSSATLGQPEIQLGVFPPAAAAVLPSIMGPQRAAEVVFLGATMTAAQAEQLGLLNRQVPDIDLQSTVDGVTTRLASYRRDALVQLKKALRAAGPDPWPGITAAERIYLDNLTKGPDAEEGLRAFLQKRKPQWAEVVAQ